jgi:hypothetical protein
MIPVENAISILGLGKMADGTDCPTDASFVLYTNKNMLKL